MHTGKQKQMNASYQASLVNRHIRRFTGMYTGRLSHIDLTISTLDLVRHLEWKIQADNRCSDHFPISILPTFRIFEPRSSYTQRTRWSVKRADWQGFAKTCKPISLPLHTTNNPSETCDHFSQCIIDSAKQHVPMIKQGRARHGNVWWNDDCQRAVARRKRALMRYKRCICQPHLIDLQRERAATQRIIRQTKKNSWLKFIGSFTVSTPLSKIWNMVRSFNNTRSVTPSLPVLSHNGQRLDRPEDVVRLFGQYFASLSNSSNYRPTFQLREQALRAQPADFSSVNDEVYNVDFSIDELNLALEAGGATSVGPDHIHYAFLKHLNTSAKEELLKMYNDMWTNDVFPDGWKSHLSYLFIKVENRGKTCLLIAQFSWAPAFAKHWNAWWTNACYGTWKRIIYSHHINLVFGKVVSVLTILSVWRQISDAGSTRDYTQLQCS